jgi:hypothetical protein
MRPNEYEQAQAWDAMIRIAVLGSLFLSALMAVSSAIVISVLDHSENANILRGLLLLFGMVAFGVALGFRKAERLTWKHWTIICPLAAPGALYIFVH